VNNLLVISYEKQCDAQAQPALRYASNRQKSTYVDKRGGARPWHCAAAMHECELNDIGPQKSCRENRPAAWQLVVDAKWPAPKYGMARVLARKAIRPAVRESARFLHKTWVAEKKYAATSSGIAHARYTEGSVRDEYVASASGSGPVESRNYAQ